MPLAWTPLISVFSAAAAPSVGVSLLSAMVGGVAAVRIRRLAADPPVAAQLAAAAAAGPLAAGERFGRWRITATSPLAAEPRGGTAARRGRRGVLAAAGLLAIGSALAAIPAVLASRGGGLDLVVAAVVGGGLLGLAARRGPAAWTWPATREPGGSPTVRRGGLLRPGRRLTLPTRSPGDSVTSPAAGEPLVLDLPAWPESAVLRHRLAAALPPAAAAAILGPGGGLPGDPPLPPLPAQPAQPAPAAPADSASTAAITAAGSDCGS